MIIESDKKLLGVSGTNDPICQDRGCFACLMWQTTIDNESRGVPLSRAEAVTIYHRLGDLLAQGEADDRVSQR